MPGYKVLIAFVSAFHTKVAQYARRLRRMRAGSQPVRVLLSAAVHAPQSDNSSGVCMLQMLDLQPCPPCRKPANSLAPRTQALASLHAPFAPSATSMLKVYQPLNQCTHALPGGRPACAPLCRRGQWHERRTQAQGTQRQEQRPGQRRGPGHQKGSKEQGTGR